MQKLLIEEKKNTPRIVLDPENNDFTFSGRSFPENSKKFFLPVLEWMTGFSPNNGSQIDFHFNFYYISSSSIISLMEVLRRLNHLKNIGCNLNIYWHYDEDDEDIRKIGEDYATFSEAPFHFVPENE